MGIAGGVNKMNYLAYANHYDIRPCRAQYLWWFYLVLDRLPESYFVINRDYLNPDPNRWEVKEWEEIPYGCRDPKDLHVKKCKVMERVEELPHWSSNRLPSDTLRACVGVCNEDLYRILDNILNEEPNIDAALTWCNNATLKAVCCTHQIPVIHNESGPLRSPYFRDTIYFDFSGVNGQTMFNHRFSIFKQKAKDVRIFTREELLRIVTKDEYVVDLSHAAPSYDCGVALQVDVDTNLLAYNYCVTTTDLISKVMKEFDGNKVLIRNHPLSSIQYARPASLGNGVVDTSKNSLEFISKCNKIVTINSSVGFEALLMGRDVEFLGANPFKNIPSMDEEEKLLALNFAVFSYLVPSKLLYDNEYYTYRIGMEKGCKDDEEALYDRGMREWEKCYGIKLLS